MAISRLFIFMEIAFHRIFSERWRGNKAGHRLTIVQLHITIIINIQEIPPLLWQPFPPLRLFLTLTIIRPNNYKKFQRVTKCVIHINETTFPFHHNATHPNYQAC